MCDIKSVCIIICLVFGLGDGYWCEKKNDSFIGCPVYKIESQDECQSYLETNDGDGNFVFYTKPLTSGHLNISLYKRHPDNSHTFIYENLFAVTMNNANQWQKIKIRRDKGRQTTLNLHITYFLEVNDQQKAGISFVIPNVVGPGNEIRVKTVTSLWSFTCDPSLYIPPNHRPTTSSQSLIQLHKSSRPNVFLSVENLHIQTAPPAKPPHPQVKGTNNETIPVLLSGENLLSLLRKSEPAVEYQPLLPTSKEFLPQILLDIKILPSTKPTTVYMISPQPATSAPPSIQPPSSEKLTQVKKISTGFPVWQLAIIAVATLVLTLVIIIVSVFFFVRHRMKNSDPVPIHPKKKLSVRLSRQVSKVLGYSTILDHNYEEVNLNSPDEGEPKPIIEE